MIDVVIPVFNEGENIKNVLDEISRKIQVKCSVIIVYDFEEDNTLPIIEQVKKNYTYDISLVKNMYGSGFGNAVRTGAQNAKSDYWVMIMADLSDDLRTVETMYKKALEGYDIVVGSRYMTGGKKNGGPFLQSIFSRLGSFVMHIIMKLPVDDVSNAFRMYRKDAFINFELESSGGADILLELLLKAYLADLKITQVPTIWNDRTGGSSNFHMWKLLPSYLHWCIFAIHKQQLKRIKRRYV